MYLVKRDCNPNLLGFSSANQGRKGTSGQIPSVFLKPDLGWWTSSTPREGSPFRHSRLQRLGQSLQFEYHHLTDLCRSLDWCSRRLINWKAIGLISPAAQYCHGFICSVVGAVWGFLHGLAAPGETRWGVERGGDGLWIEIAEGEGILSDWNDLPPALT